MPPLPVVPKTAQVRVFMETGTGGAMLHQCQNVLYWSWLNPGATDADMNAMALNVLEAYQDLFSGVLTGGTHYISDDTTITGVTVVDLESNPGPFAIQHASSPGAASQISLAQSAMLFRKPVLRRFRGGHCRTYLPGITPDNTSDGRTWTTGAQTDLLSWFTTMIARVNVGHYTGGYPNIGVPFAVQVSYYDREVNPVPPYRRTTPVVDPVDMTLVSVDPVLRSQRRRVRLSPTPS